MPDTNDDLAEAFAGESQACQKYRAFARKADEEGLPNVAALFRTAAEAETIHAAGHLDAMDGVGSTAENLQSALDGETLEYTEMYPPMIERAQETGHRAQRMFGLAAKAERIHADLYEKALDAVKQGHDIEEQKFYLCKICGYVEAGSPPDNCPVCGAPASQFEET
jgi:rubrerythrin